MRWQIMPWSHHSEYLLRCLLCWWLPSYCPLFALTSYCWLRFKVLRQSFKYHTSASHWQDLTRFFLKGIWEMWFQAFHLSFPLSSCVTYSGKSSLTLKAERGFTLLENHFLAQSEITHRFSKSWLPSWLSSLNAPTRIINIPSASCKILGRWWSSINIHWVNKLYQQILNEREPRRRIITLRSTLGPRILLVMRRVICPCEMSDTLLVPRTVCSV